MCLCPYGIKGSGTKSALPRVEWKFSSFGGEFNQRRHQNRLSLQCWHRPISQCRQLLGYRCCRLRSWHAHQHHQVAHLRQIPHARATSNDRGAQHCLWSQKRHAGLHRPYQLQSCLCRQRRRLRPFENTEPIHHRGTPHQRHPRLGVRRDTIR